jgi:glycosyltransferase involved in cell wall biosynthesis
MMRTIASVIRGEGFASALRRGVERIEEGILARMKLARGAFANDRRVSLLNVSATSLAPRLGGMQIQLAARLAFERRLREVALLHPGVLELSTHARRVTSLEDALAITGATAVHLEGTSGVDIDEVMRATDRDLRVIVSLHDLSLTSRELLQRATAVIVPSEFLREHYRVPHAHVIPPGVAPASGRPPKEAGRRPALHGRSHVAIVGSVKEHKGGHLLAEIITSTNADWHVFGGGDEDLLRPLHGIARIHGYYRRGTLPRLLARHGIGLAVLPSITPESFGLTLSECWLAGVPAVAFAHGALGERIARHGGGWVTPLDRGAAGIADLVRRRLAGELATTIPTHVPTARDAADAHLSLYRELGL